MVKLVEVSVFVNYIELLIEEWMNLLSFPLSINIVLEVQVMAIRQEIKGIQNWKGRSITFIISRLHETLY